VHVIEQLALAAEQQFDIFGEHLWRVSALSIQIAHMLGLDGQFVGQLGEAARLHDIGKIAVPDAILQKAGELTHDEWIIMQSHTVLGAQLLADGHSDLAEMAVQIALSHHERWDGTGYPHGLQGEAIPLAARIVAVADVFDALVSRRVYKEPWPAEHALAEIRRKAGRWFDPQVVSAFVQVMGQPTS
jgi:putative two-component system response regulator